MVYNVLLNPKYKTRLKAHTDKLVFNQKTSVNYRGQNLILFS